MVSFALSVWFNWDLVMPCSLGHRIYKQWRVICSVPRYKLNQFYFVVSCISEKYIPLVIVSTSNGVWFVLYQDINWTNSILLLVASLRNFIMYFCHLNMWSPTPVIPLLSWRYRPVMLPFVVNARISFLLNSSYIQTSQNIVCPLTQSKLEKNAGNSSGTK